MKHILNAMRIEADTLAAFEPSDIPRRVRILLSSLSVRDACTLCKAFTRRRATSRVKAVGYITEEVMYSQIAKERTMY